MEKQFVKIYVDSDGRQEIEAEAGTFLSLVMLGSAVVDFIHELKEYDYDTNMSMLLRIMKSYEEETGNE